MPRTSKPYTPKPGSLAAQVISHLQSKDGPASMTAAEISGVFGVTSGSVQAMLKGALNARVLAHFIDTSSPTRRRAYRLSTPADLRQRTLADVGPAADARSTNRKAKLDGAPLEALATWADGDVSFTVPGPPLEDGQVVLTRAQFQQLLAFVTTPYCVLPTTPAARAEAAYIDV